MPLYILPTIQVIDVITLKTLIHAYANSGIGCPGSSADYTSGGGCGYAYTNGSCTASHNCDAAHYN